MTNSTNNGNGHNPEETTPEVAYLPVYLPSDPTV